MVMPRYKSKPHPIPKRLADVLAARLQAQHAANPYVNLPSLITDINAAHRAGKADMRRGVEWFHRCGVMLHQAKDEVKRRREKWGPHRKQLAFGPRRAQRYMLLSKSDVTSPELPAIWSGICGNDKRRDAAPNPVQPGMPGPIEPPKPPEGEKKPDEKKPDGERPKPPEKKPAPDIHDDGLRLIHLPPIPTAVKERYDRLINHLRPAVGSEHVHHPVDLLIEGLEILKGKRDEA